MSYSFFFSSPVCHISSSLIHLLYFLSPLLRVSLFSPRHFSIPSFYFRRLVCLFLARVVPLLPFLKTHDIYCRAQLLFKQNSGPVYWIIGLARTLEAKSICLFESCSAHNAIRDVITRRHQETGRFIGKHANTTCSIAPKYTALHRNAENMFTLRTFKFIPLRPGLFCGPPRLTSTGYWGLFF
jgi:hypothetical protein